ncbi:hypothetical protein OIU85_004728 [Salix viminalis]|uniref:Uncharacterized protein n=1 Tax=Salix viminalis TaxID=40686 RepID=A0A9Q0SXR1_SALVM|nr:hypothetical protein OIU85_004728 [Salix viminalis]
MDFCRNVTLSADYHQQEKVLASPPPCPKLAAAASTATTLPLDDLFSAQKHVLSSAACAGFCPDKFFELKTAYPVQETASRLPQLKLRKPNTEDIPPKTWKQKPQDQEHPSPLKKPVIPGKVKKQEEKAFCKRTGWLIASSSCPEKRTAAAQAWIVRCREESGSDQGKVGAAAGSGGGRDRFESRGKQQWTAATKEVRPLPGAKNTTMEGRTTGSKNTLQCVWSEIQVREAVAGV